MKHPPPGNSVGADMNGSAEDIRGGSQMKDLETTRDRRGLALATFVGAILVVALAVLNPRTIAQLRSDCTPLAISVSQEKAALLGEIADAHNNESRASSGA